MDRPGGSTHLVNNQSSDCSNCPQNMKNYISKDSQSTVGTVAGCKQLDNNNDAII